MDERLSPELHPVGTRLLVRLVHFDYEDRTIYEVVVVEWSRLGFVKLRFDNTGDGEDWGSWHQAGDVRILEVLP